MKNKCMDLLGRGRRCRIGLALAALVGLWLPAGTPASAQGTGWQINTVFPTYHGVAGRALWIKPGITDVNGNYSGDMASVWTVDANGHVTAQGPTYGPYPEWRAEEIDVASDGTARLKWQIDGSYSSDTGTSSGDTVSLWTLDATGKVTVKGPTYGPYPGWTDDGFQVAPDNTTRLFWNHAGTTDINGNYSGDQLSLWTLNSAGAATAQGPTYGPYPGWRSDYSYQINADSTTRVIWIHSGSYASGSGDTVSVWSFNAAGKATAQGPSYGPYPGWTTGFGESAPDNTTRLLWVKRGMTDSNNNYTGDQISLWTLNPSGAATAQGPTYGPYPGWRGDYFQVASDNTVRLLWNNTGTYSNGDGTGTYSGDQVSLWSFNSVGKATATGPTYGRYPGWTGNQFDIAPDNTVRLLWISQGTTDANGTYSGDMTTLWSFNTAGSATTTGPIYGPNPGWRASYAYPLTSSVTDLLWLHDAPGTATNGYSSFQDEFTLWTLVTSDTVTSMGPTYGPY